jgi:UDP-glucose 4-epimerase
MDPDFSFSILRYFNAAGCSLDGMLGEDHRPETHLIPLVLQTSLGRLKKLDILGDDYDTLDGTCVRDYVHVEDLVRAHMMVMEILKPGDTRFYNLGNGCGYSVYEIIAAVEKITKTSIHTEIKKRRIGDVAALFSDSSKAKKEVGWEAKIDLDGIIESAWRWFRDSPNGYLTRFRCNF